MENEGKYIPYMDPMGYRGKVGGGNSIFLMFTPNFGELIQFWRAYFSKGLKPPTSKIGGLWSKLSSSCVFSKYRSIESRKFFLVSGTCFRHSMGRWASCIFFLFGRVAVGEGIFVLLVGILPLKVLIPKELDVKIDEMATSCCRWLVDHWGGARNCGWALKQVRDQSENLDE